MRADRVFVAPWEAFLLLGARRDPETERQKSGAVQLLKDPPLFLLLQELIAAAKQASRCRASRPDREISINLGLQSKIQDLVSLVSESLLTNSRRLQTSPSYTENLST